MGKVEPELGVHPGLTRAVVVTGSEGRRSRLRHWGSSPGPAEPPGSSGWAVWSTLMLTLCEAVPPALVATQVKVTPGVSVVTLCVLQPTVMEIADSSSTTLQDTLTLLVYHPLLPRVPVMFGVMTGGVLSIGGGHGVVGTGGGEVAIARRIGGDIGRKRGSHGPTGGHPADRNVKGGAVVGGKLGDRRRGRSSRAAQGDV